MKVLIACEESQRVCIAFRKRGHEAYSCDLQECSGGHPEWHIKCNVLNVLNPIKKFIPGDSFEEIEFTTCDGENHKIFGKWDLIIAHPPCTYLSNAGANSLYKKVNGVSMVNWDRYKKGIEGKRFFMTMLHADCEKIAVENPIPSKIYELPKYTQIIQPYEYGHAFSKKTCLWLKNLPKLKPTNIITEYVPYTVSGMYTKTHDPKYKGVSRKGGASKVRSKTFTGIAEAMAEQWGGVINE